MQCEPTIRVNSHCEHALSFGEDYATVKYPKMSIQIQFTFDKYSKVTCLNEPELDKVHDDIVVRQVNGTRRICDVSRVQYHACVLPWAYIQVTRDAGSTILNQICVGNPLLATAQGNNLQRWRRKTASKRHIWSDRNLLNLSKCALRRTLKWPNTYLDSGVPPAAQRHHARHFSCRFVYFVKFKRLPGQSVNVKC